MWKILPDLIFLAVVWSSGNLCFVQVAMYQFHILGYSYDLVGHAQTERCELVLTWTHIPYELVGHAQTERCELVLLTVHFPICNIVKEHWI